MKIVVLGGGTAGYLSALTVKSFLPEVHVSVVASKTIGTLGPGEGLTPMFHMLLDKLNITMDEFLSKTGGTLKAGINFINWNKSKNSQYLETFSDPFKNLSNEELKKIFIEALYSDSGLESINPYANATKSGKILFDNRDTYTYHINAKLAVEFFEELSLKIGISVIDKIVSGIDNDESGNVKNLVFDDGDKISADIFIDCSGFKRIIVGKHYNVEWIDIDKYLPTNSAIACTAPIGENKKMYTEAVALDYGWAWKIPLQDRFGCGYVYDKNYITAEMAEEELRGLIGDGLQVVGKFSFNSGFYKEALHKNVLCSGLSYGFFEPLEASSLDRTISIIIEFVEQFLKNNSYQNLNKEELCKKIDLFNLEVMQASYELLDFIRLHYVTNKDNTLFWKNLKNDITEVNYQQHKMLSIKTIDGFMQNFNDLRESVFSNTWKFMQWSTVLCENLVDRSNHDIDNIMV